MMDLLQSFFTDLNAGPTWVVVWVNFMSVVIGLAVPFAFVRVEARWLLAVMAGTILFGGWLYASVGYERLLGLAHVVFWTPFVIYLWRRRGRWRVSETISGKWLVLLFIIMSISLVIDYVDVARYVLGDRL